MKTKIQQKYDAFVSYFEEHMPVAETELEYKDPYQLLVAVILSAQCTDKRVNMTTPALFQRFPMAKDTVGHGSDFGARLQWHRPQQSGGHAKVAWCGPKDCQCDDGCGLRQACYAGRHACVSCL